MSGLKLSGVQVGKRIIYDQIRFLGLDCANSYVKMVGDFGSMVYPNTIKDLDARQKEIFMMEAEHKQYHNLKTDKIVFTFEGSDYIIGTARKDSIESLDKDFDRHSKDNFRKNFILAVARVAKNGDNFVICSGLPSDSFMVKKNRDSFARLHGTYTIERSGVPVTFKISYIHVELEPRGTYLNTIYQLEGDKITAKNLEIKNAKYVGILDVGYGTTDYAEFIKGSDGMVTLGDTKGINIAMSDGYTKLRANLSKDYPTIMKKPLIEIENDLRIEGMIQPSGAVIPKEVLDVEVKKAFEDVAETIIKELKTQIQTDTLNYLIFTGGAMVTLKNYFKNGLEGNYTAVSIKDAQISNAKGYLLRIYMLEKTGQLQTIITNLKEGENE